jgi:uncharacterized protein YigA (DUF484 family)
MNHVVDFLQQVPPYFIQDEAILNKIKVEAKKKILKELERTLKNNEKEKEKHNTMTSPETKKK